MACGCAQQAGLMYFSKEEYAFAASLFGPRRYFIILAREAKKYLYMVQGFTPITGELPEGTLFGDKRLSERFHWLERRMTVRTSSIINRITSDHAGRQASYRFMRNGSVEAQQIIGQGQAACLEACKGREVIVAGDTSEFSLKEQAAHLKDREEVGVLSDNETPGFIAHANMAMDSQSGEGLGLSSLALWARQRATPGGGKKVARPYEQRESYKWEMGIQQSEEVLRHARSVTYVFDRESDIYLLFAAARAMGPGRNLISRVRYCRKVLHEGAQSDLDSLLGSTPFSSAYKLKVRRRSRRNCSSGKLQPRKARTSKIKVRYTPVSLCPPAKLPSSAGPLELWLVEALEDPGTVPAGEAPVHWRLLTTHEVGTDEMAMQIIRWYEMRWMIEQLFRLLKLKGFDMEHAELEYFSSILKLTAMAFGAALKVLQLVLARDNPDAQPIGEVFSGPQQACLAALNKKFQGNTAKQQNPWPAESLSWAAWVIARIGGWKGLASQGPPGPITMKRGLDSFNVYYDAWRLFSPGEDVCNS